jgi:uncharacterized membrane-anchored protein YjiN (DUF445 family)
MEKIAELKRAKLLALSLLLVAAAAFIITLFFLQASAAMVRGCAG